MLRAEEVYNRILCLRQKIASLVKSEDDLAKPEVVALSREISELTVLYNQLKGSQRDVHDCSSKRTDGVPYVVS